MTVGGWVGHVWADGPADGTVWALVRPVLAPHADAQLVAIRVLKTRPPRILPPAWGAEGLLDRCERLRTAAVAVTLDHHPGKARQEPRAGDYPTAHADPACRASSGRPVEAEPGYPAPTVTGGRLAYEALYGIDGDDRREPWVRRCPCLLSLTPPVSLTARRRRRTP